MATREFARRVRPLLLVVGAPTLIAVACETVDLGSVPSDINACRPSQSYYAGVPSTMADGGTTGDIWQNLLAKDYGGRHCSDQACHGTGSNNPLRLMTPSCLPANGCTPPIPLTMEWATNYRATTEEMNCSNVKASKLLTVPGGIFPGHAGGTLFNANDANAPEYQLIISWVGAPP